MALDPYWDSLDFIVVKIIIKIVSLAVLMWNDKLM